MSQIIMMSFLNSILFSFMSHPMNMGIMLLIQTLLMCLLMGIMSQTSWFSYILFLVFLGGMLVLFIYMTSIASNELFKIPKYIPTIIMLSTMIVGMLIITWLLSPLYSTMNNTDETLSLIKMSENNESLMLMPLYNKPSSHITIFMVLYLFLTLIVVVTITKFNSGPLRPTY